MTSFASFDPEPLAAASIGQAHAATLDDGTEVVVKVRRPDAVEQVEQDLEILQDLGGARRAALEAAADSTRWARRRVRADAPRRARLPREGRNAERFAVELRR